MALTTIPPWLNVGPETYLGAAKAGASAGQEAANALNQYNLAQQQMASHAATAAAQIGAERERAAAALALQKAHQEATHELNLAHLDLSRNRLADLNDYRARENDLRQQGLDQRDAAAALRNNYLHVGEDIVAPDGKGGFKVLYRGGANKMHPLDRMDYDAATKSMREAEQKLSAGGLSAKDQAFWQGIRDAADNTKKSIRSRYPGAITESPDGASLLDNMTPGDSLPAGGPAWNAPIPDIGSGGFTAPSLPDSAIDLGLPNESAPEVRVLNIRPKQ